MATPGLTEKALALTLLAAELLKYGGSHPIGRPSMLPVIAVRLLDMYTRR